VLARRDAPTSAVRLVNHAPFALVKLALFAMSWWPGTLDGVVHACLLVPFCGYFAMRATLETPLRAVSLPVASVIALHFVRLNPDLANAAHADHYSNGVVWITLIWTVIGFVLSVNLGLAWWHARQV
jgi:hypothetical protein